MGIKNVGGSTNLWATFFGGRNILDITFFEVKKLGVGLNILFGQNSLGVIFSLCQKFWDVIFLNPSPKKVCQNNFAGVNGGLRRGCEDPH